MQCIYVTISAVCLADDPLERTQTTSRMDGLKLLLKVVFDDSFSGIRFKSYQEYLGLFVLLQTEGYIQCIKFCFHWQKCRSSI